MKSKLAFLAVAFAAIVAPLQAQAQKWPEKPVRLVVPFAAGGGTDALARTFARQLSDDLGQQFFVENRAGAGGMLGAEYVARSSPDGYTFIFVPASYSAAANPALYKLPYDPIKGIAPVSIVATLPLMIVVNPSLEAKNLEELIAQLRANPGTLSYGSSGNGGTFHLAAELFRQMTKTEMVHIPYKGSAPAIIDLLAGRIQLMFSDLGPVMPHIKSGKLRAIAVTSAKRSPALPDVPTIGEAIPGYVVNSWFGIWGPAGTPRAVVLRFNEALGRVLKRPEVLERLRLDGNEPAHSTPEEFARIIADDITMWSDVVKAGKITVQ